MYEPGKMHNVVQEMKGLKIDILGISDEDGQTVATFQQQTV